MKKLALALLLLQTTLLSAGKPAPFNPADYPLTVHVYASYALGQLDPARGGTIQRLETTIGDQQVELQGITWGILALGDYKARAYPSPYLPKHPNGYDLYLRYEIVMPDGTLRGYDVTGISQKPDAPGIGSATSPKP